MEDRKNKLKTTNADACSFAECSECVDEVKSIAGKVSNLTENPTETEILSRCCMIFECILHEAMGRIDGVKTSDLKKFCVEIERDE